MKVMKNTKLIVCVLIMVGIFVQNALAMPYSTYGSENKWQGYKNYNGDGVNMTLVFNVYDTVANPTEFSWSGGKPNDDRYVYAYQIINKSDSQDISLFSLLDKAKNPLAQQLMSNSSSQWDGSTLSIAPSPKVCTEQGVWEWSAVSGDPLAAGKNSWLLILSSDNAPTRGSFKVESGTESNPIVPGNETPEPCTLALFGIASALYAAKRGRKRQAE